MTLIDIQTQKRYKCHLITAERASYEKYLGGQWFKFWRECMLEVGGKLIFDLEKPPKNMHVQVVPALLTNHLNYNARLDYLDLAMLLLCLILSNVNMSINPFW